MSKRRSVESQVQDLYRLVPELDCKGLCQDCCGPIAMSRFEWRKIVKIGGRAPAVDETLTCTLLNKETGRCSVYEARPGICRIWGTTPTLKCPHGCKPKDTLSDNEARFILTAIEQAGGGMKDTIPRSATHGSEDHQVPGLGDR